ncbi:hypothetical protein [Rhodopirellula sallentina]|uniref:Uncharacterized protein n=1 Tax=Rhodopirellula sallentina SM41 TaxID=1263870 RepID=M5TUB1_9BACT|nr:hypothetical protein [Rhodopirellula sallentina]EMI52649.1 hypothetical protein RSSM_05919 [Rhodopirellula sallentina SM41]
MRVLVFSLFLVASSVGCNPSGPQVVEPAPMTAEEAAAAEAEYERSMTQDT